MKTAASLYGSSLYDLAKEENLGEPIMQQLEQIERIFKENPAYISLLLEPAIPQADRLKLIDEAFGEDAEPYVMNFLKLTCENGVLRNFSECVGAYRARYDADYGIARGIVVSAIPLTEEQKAALTKKLQAESGKTVILTEKVDPGVLGGLRVEFDGRMLDGTVGGHLSELRTRVNETVV